MGKYRRIEKLIETSVSDYTNINIVPRGTPLFPDLLLTGKIRFAKRTGANFSVLNPDNLVYLSQDSEVNSQQIYVSSIIKWFEKYALVSFNGVEMLEIYDIDIKNSILTVSQTIPTVKNSGEKLMLWAVPLVLRVSALQGADSLIIGSKYKIVNGDKICFPISPLLNSIKEFKVVLAESAGSSGDPDYPYIYNVVLEESIPVSLDAGVSKVYLRAYPSYSSNRININKFSNWQLGPFLLDYLASPLNSKISYPTTFSIRTLTKSEAPIEGAYSSFKTVDKNYPVIQRPLWSENILFWKVLRGSGGFIYPNKYRMVTNSEGHFRVSTDIVPSMQPGQTWKFKVTPNSKGSVRINIEPHGFVDYEVEPHQTKEIELSTSVGSQPITKLEFLCKLETPNSEVILSDSVLVGNMVSYVEYNLIFELIGDSNFQSTGIILKPYFLSLSDLSSNYDTDQKYNSGFIYR